MTEPGERETPTALHPERGRRARSSVRPKHKISVVGVLGEVLVTAGVLVLLFLGWQNWLNSAVLSGQQSSAAEQQSKKFLEHGKDGPAPTATPVPKPTDGSLTPAFTYGTPPVMKAPGAAEAFAVIYVPRFGADWKRTIRESVDVETVLNSYDAGVGHYPNTQMPGAVGNFAVAAHDTGYGNTFIDVSKLRVGDAIYVQTKDGYYTYRFRNYEYVQPGAVSVLQPVPQTKGAKPTDRLITLTTCNPPYAARERLIAFGVFESWQPLSAGAPTAIASEVAGG